MSRIVVWLPVMLLVMRIVSASRMNNAIVLFLKTIELANQLTETGVVIDVFTSVVPLSMPSKKVILSNVPPFISDEVLEQTLLHYGKLVSTIKKFPIAPLLKHVVSFRRFVYMILKDNKDELDLTMNVTVDNFNYVIYATTSVMKCFGCGQTGHLIRACPDKKDSVKTLEDKESSNVNGSKDDVAEVESNATNSSVTIEGEAAACAPGPVSEAQEQNAADASEQVLVENHSDKNTDGDGSYTPLVDVMTYFQKCQGSNDNATDGAEVPLEDMETSVLAEGDKCFKIPSKKRKKKASQNNKEAERALIDLSDNESESDFSDCSISYSLRLSGYRTRNYRVEDIKKFLKDTKHSRKVRVDEFFQTLSSL